MLFTLFSLFVGLTRETHVLYYPQMIFLYFTLLFCLFLCCFFLSVVEESKWNIIFIHVQNYVQKRNGRKHEKKCCEHNERTTRSPTCLKVIPCTFCVVKLLCFFVWKATQNIKTGKITNKWKFVLFVSWA